MSFFNSLKIRLFGFYLLLVIFACLPIWSVEFYINQDGSPHLYNAYIILQLLADNPVFSQIYALNYVPIPNLTGHWFLTTLLIVFSPFIVTKIFVTFCYAAFVAAIGWLRWQTVGREGMTTAFLLGAATAFNWMWFLGFYNFIIGVIGFTFTLGLYCRWRENLNIYRSLVFSILIIFVYLSHLISFGMLIGSLIILGVFVSPTFFKKTITWTLISFTPVLPFVISYKLASEAGGGLSPVWRYLENPFSLSNWILQLQAADPFQLLSRKAFPFAALDSNLYALFSPLLWLTAAFLCLSLATWFLLQRREFLSRRFLPFALLTFFSIIFWVFAPDDFGKSHGSFLRERVLLCGLICFVPLFRIVKFSWFQFFAQVCLVFIIIFQTAVLWEYSINADEIGREYLSGKEAIKDSDSFASIVLIENGCRYKANPLTNLNVLYGIGKNTRIWDNYELGYYLFPVVARNPSDRQFIFNFRESNAFDLCNPNENIDEKLAHINSLLDSHNDKISVMLVWGSDERVEAVFRKWFEEKPFFQNERVRLFRRR